MKNTYDCIILGVGGFGSGALLHAARRGRKVLGLEQFEVAHDRGSSHGETRIIRKAYFEHPDYVPLLLRAYDLWRDLEKERGQKLMHLCGLLLAGPPAGEAVGGARLSAQQHSLPLESLNVAEARKRFPAFRFREEFEAVYESDAGFLEVENCVRAHIESACNNGAAIKTNETVVRWSSDGRTIRVRTDRDEYSAASLIITAGAWSRAVLANLNVPLEVVRKPLLWHEVETSSYDVSRGAPAYLYEMPHGVFYGFPSIDGRLVKVAQHSGGAVVADPFTVDRGISEDDTKPVAAFLEEALPEVCPQPARHAVCMYTNTPDRHFIIDKHPEFGNVAIGAGFSGHGFKFTSVLGEALADLALQGSSVQPIGFLSLAREGLQMR